MKVPRKPRGSPDGSTKRKIPAQPKRADPAGQCPPGSLPSPPQNPQAQPVDGLPATKKRPGAELINLLRTSIRRKAQTLRDCLAWITKRYKIIVGTVALFALIATMVASLTWMREQAPIAGCFVFASMFGGLVGGLTLLRKKEWLEAAVAAVFAFLAAVPAFVLMANLFAQSS